MAIMLKFPGEELKNALFNMSVDIETLTNEAVLEQLANMRLPASDGKVYTAFEVVRMLGMEMFLLGNKLDEAIQAKVNQPGGVA